MAADAAATSSALRSGTPGPASQNWNSRRSLKNSISSTIPRANEARARVWVLPLCSALPICSAIGSMSALVWVRGRSSPSRCRWGEPRWRTSRCRTRTQTQESTPSRGTILVVEDDPAVRELLQLLFDDDGHRTLVAADGHKALELAAQGSSAPNLVIADYNLPNGLNGLEVIASLRKQLQHDIPAIVLTGDISTDALREIARHGCVHLNKPVRAKELTRHVQRLLAKATICRTRARAAAAPPSGRGGSVHRIRGRR